MAEKFVKAVSKPSRPDMNPIRYGVNVIILISLLACYFYTIRLVQ